MPNRKQCEGCGGEDCGCCEIYLEAQADARADLDPRDNEPDPDTGRAYACTCCGTEISEDEADNNGGLCEECADGCGHEDQPREDMDGDHATALASAGFGTDEDYEHDTPLGDEYEN